MGMIYFLRTAVSNLYLICFLLSIVFCETGIAPQDHEPLKKLLKRTINHVKSFLGEFEKKIRDSRLIVREIHNQSLLSTNYSTTDIPDNTTELNLLVQDLDEFEDAEAPENLNVTIEDSTIVKRDGEYMFFSPAEYDTPVWNKTVAQRRASTREHPKYLKYKSLSNAKFQNEDKTNQLVNTNFFLGFSTATSNNNYLKRPKRLMRQDLASGKSVYLDNLRGIRRLTSTTKQPKRLMRQGPVRFLSEDDIVTQQEMVSPQVFSESTVAQNTTTVVNATTVKHTTDIHTVTHNTPLKYNTTAKRTATKHANLTKHIGRRKDQFEEKLENKPKEVNKKILFKTKLTKGATKSTKRKQKHYYTLSNFHFRLKEDVFAEPEFSYPDIFIRGAEVTEPTTKTTWYIATYPQHMLFKTESITDHNDVVIPELTKDYQNINFRARSSDEDPDSLLPFSPHTLNNFSNQASNKLNLEHMSLESKYFTSKNAFTTSRDTRKKTDNEKVRKIIAASSYSLSDEESYIKVKLLDQLYHYNTTAKPTWENKK